jgi:hypothetical protein
MKYFKLKTFGDSISIDETELARALYAQVTGKVAILKNGSITGNQIFSITPDFHKAMGYNEGYKLTPEDHNDISNRCKSYDGFIGDVKQQLTQAMLANKVEDFLKLEDKKFLPTGNSITT